MEIRTLQNQLTAENRKIRGYGIVFNHESRDLGGFVEIILPEAITQELIDSSDIKVYLEHNEQRGMLARRKNGGGSLNISVDSKGVVYEFDAPHTALGDEVLEGLNRRDYDESSFAFVVKRDRWEERNGKYIRYIEEIESLHDFSIVTVGAYSDTYVEVAKRSLDNYKEEMTDKERIKELEAELEQLRTSNEPEPEKEEAVKEEIEKLEDKIEEERKLKPKEERMGNFSLLKAINDIANGRTLDERALDVDAQGRAEMRKSGQNCSGQIVVPVEQRAGYIQATVATAGQEIVAEDKLNILEGLRAKSVLNAAGATYMTNLIGNVSIPKYTGSQVGWEGEVNPAKDGKGEFSDVKLSPKRLTAYIDISKQFLNQDSVSAEEMLKRDIVNAITEKLEATILGTVAGDTEKPGGLFVNAGAATISHAGVVAMEQTLEEQNVSGDFKFIVSPAIKAKLKTTALDAGSGKFLMEGNEVNGYPVLSTSACSGIIFGNFADLVIAQWGA
jgi:HK97 family phage major capsid protein/HK97 family phage prohead protease